MSKAQPKRRPPQDNYKRKLNYLARLGLFPAGSVAHVIVEHDDACAFWHGGRCNCDPNVLKQWPVGPCDN